MLARPETRRCIECGMSVEAPGFVFHGGRIEDGPAYWCDRGILCGPRCSLAHHKHRAAENTLPDRPAPEPFSFR